MFIYFIATCRMDPLLPNSASFLPDEEVTPRQCFDICPTLWKSLWLLETRLPTGKNLMRDAFPLIFHFTAPITNPNRTGVGLTGGRNRPIAQTRYSLRPRPPSTDSEVSCPWCGEVGNHRNLRRMLRDTQIGSEGLGYTDLTRD